MTRENMCRQCGDYGHNKRTCPEIIKFSDSVVEAMKVGGHTNLRDLMQDEEGPCRLPWEDADRIGWREIEAYKYRQDMGERNNDRRSRVRKCSYCDAAGHNRRTCKVKTETNNKQAKIQSYVHRFVACVLRASKCVPGSLVSTKVSGYDKDWNTLEPVTVYGLVTDINWDVVGKYDSDTAQLPLEDVLRTMIGTSLLNVKWTMPPAVDGNRLHEPANAQPVAANALGCFHSPHRHIVGQRDYEFVAGPDKANEWAAHNKNYKGADFEGCPAGWNIKFAPLDKKEIENDESGVFERSGIIQHTDESSWYTEVVSFDERER